MESSQPNIDARQPIIYYASPALECAVRRPRGFDDMAAVSAVPIFAAFFQPACRRHGGEPVQLFCRF
jgi:hypothetical protein